jgi:oligopeptide transport system substrate-binding protein
MLKGILIIASILITFIGLFFMQKEKKEQLRKDNILKTAFYSDVTTFHFAASNKGSYNSTLFTMPWLFDGLMRKGENESPELAVAEKVDISPDQKKYTFYLRDSQWSDGTDVTAYDFEYAWKTLLDPQSKSRTILPELFYPIRNVRKFIREQCSFEDVGINVVDNKTLVLDLEYPASYMLETLCIPVLYPIPKHIVEKDPEWCNKPGFVCNGPFFLKIWRINSEIELSKNPLYWDQKHVYLDGINVAIIQDYHTAINLFEKGKLDWLGDPFMKMPYDTSYKTLTEKKDDASIYFLIFNNDKYPFKNKKLRKALSLSLNRKDIVENVFHDTAAPVMSIFPHSLRLRNDPYFKDNDVEKAKILFKEALEELDKTIENFPQIELLYNTDIEWRKKVCLAAQDEWRKKLGLKVSLKGLSGINLFIDTIQKGDYQIAITGLMAPVFDPLIFLQLYENKTDTVNRCNWENEKYKKILQESNNSLGDVERAQLMIKAEEILMEEMPVIPICSMNKVYGKNPKLQGERLSYLQFVDFKSAYLR